MSDCSDIWIDGDTLFAGIAALAAGRALDKESVNTVESLRECCQWQSLNTVTGHQWKHYLNLSAVLTDSLSRALAAGGAYLLYRAAGGMAIRKKRDASTTFMEIFLIGNNK